MKGNKMSDASINIPKDVLEPIIQAHIQTAIANALGGNQAIVASAVGRILEEKVDSDGRPSRYSSEVTFIQWLARSSLQEAAKKALTEEVAKHEAAIKAEIVRQLQKKNSPIIKALVDGLVGHFAGVDNLRYRLTVEVK